MLNSAPTAMTVEGSLNFANSNQFTVDHGCWSRIQQLLFGNLVKVYQLFVLILKTAFSNKSKCQHEYHTISMLSTFWRIFPRIANLLNY